jgi:hypothetical protein
MVLKKTAPLVFKWNLYGNKNILNLGYFFRQQDFLSSSLKTILCQIFVLKKD